MLQFLAKKTDTFLGWILFLLSFSVYYQTAEPTTSFWDVGEYIATSSKLQIGHPPGAPFFQIFGAFFSIFAPDSSKVAFTLHLVSALSAALTIAILYWTVRLIIRRLSIVTDNNQGSSSLWFSGSAFVGALGFAFTDSFWFNAVEAEVYSMATLTLSLLFYLGLRWIDELDQPQSNRYVLLISLLIGLASGIHFLSFLVIPALVLLYLFEKSGKITFLQFLGFNILSVTVLLFIFKILLPVTLHFFGYSEIFLVNTFGLPFHTGSLIAGLFLLLIFGIALYYSKKHGFVRLHTYIVSILMILIGFSCWIMIPIRANANVVINENNPDNARELLAYYNMEQYQHNPLFYGPVYTELYAGLDEERPYKDGKPKYRPNREINRYEIVNSWKSSVHNFDDGHKTIFPRMWSTSHIPNYMEYNGVPSFTLKPEFRQQKDLVVFISKFRKKYASGEVDSDGYHEFLQQFGRYLDIEKPTFFDNFTFFIQYQIGYMYWRYFMWNFVGKQNDIQGKNTLFDGNWLSGISFIDSWHLFDQSNLPESFKNNKGRNTYYFLPLLVGIIGLVFHYKQDRKTWWILLVFFLSTGIALKIYLNEKPFEVRERDYALVGSFYVFAIWISLGILKIIQEVRKRIPSRFIALLTLLVCFMAFPIVMASENWDDHDRSDRYTAQAMAKNYMSNCQENAILFTVGDNDTFPLWYVQEIERYRPDIRLACTAYLSTDWYIDQMKRKTYRSEPVPSQLTYDFYKHGSNDLIYYDPISTSKKPVPIKQWLNWIQSDHPKTKGSLQNGDTVNTFPSKYVRIPVQKETVLKNNIVSQENTNQILEYIDIEITEDHIYKHQLFMLDIIANNKWNRPIYFSSGSFDDAYYLWMKEYLRFNGLTYQLLPIHTPLNEENPYDFGCIDTDLLYNQVKNWEWGNGNDPSVYLDPETRRNAISYRNAIARLATELIREKEKEKALEILDLGIEQFPVNLYEFYTPLFDFVTGYYQLKQKKKARKLWNEIISEYQQQLLYYSSMSLPDQYRNAQSIITAVEYYKVLITISERYENKEYINAKRREFNEYISLYSSLIL